MSNKDSGNVGRVQWIIDQSNLDIELTGEETNDELAAIVDRCYAEGDVSIHWWWSVFLIRYLLLL